LSGIDVIERKSSGVQFSIAEVTTLVLRMPFRLERGNETDQSESSFDWAILKLTFFSISDLKIVLLTSVKQHTSRLFPLFTVHCPFNLFLFWWDNLINENVSSFLFQLPTRYSGESVVGWPIRTVHPVTILTYSMPFFKITICLKRDFRKTALKLKKTLRNNSIQFE
jgi:hypothetical protein